MPGKNSSIQGLQRRAEKVLDHNDRGTFTVPSEGLYPHQVLWDSCFIAIGRRHYDIERAKSEVLSLLRGQWSNGMVPHIIFTEGVKYKLDRRGWQSWVNPYSPEKVSTSGVSQPPMLAEAILRIGEKLNLTERKAWYNLIFPSLLVYHKWLYNERDPNKTGLVMQLHPWETGLDNTPSSMSELHNYPVPWWIKLIKMSHLDKIGDSFRIDVKYVPADQRSSTIEALEFYNLQVKLRKNKFLINNILADLNFGVEDLTYNCILIKANEALTTIAKTIGQDLPELLASQMKQTINSLEALWDPETNQYYSREFNTKNLIKEPSVATLMPLYTHKITKQRAHQLVKLLEDKQLFKLPYPIPSVPVNSPWFKPKSYWQGATWININWFIIDGLKYYGFIEQANKLTKTSLDLVDKGGFHEYFDPLTGEPAGADKFSWTAGLTIDLIHST
jgi:hypothetical protein